MTEMQRSVRGELNSYELFNEDQTTEHLMNQERWMMIPKNKRSQYDKWHAQPRKITIQNLTKNNGGLYFDHPTHVDFSILRRFKNKHSREYISLLKAQSQSKKTTHKKKIKKKPIQKPYAATTPAEELLTTLKQQQEKLRSLCQKMDLTLEPEIAETSKNIREIKQKLEDKNVDIPNELNKKIEEVFLYY